MCEPGSPEIRAPRETDLRDYWEFRAAQISAKANVDMQLMHELVGIPEDIQVHLVPTLCPLAVSPFDFSASRELIGRAVESTNKWIEEGGLTRRSLPKELAKKLGQGAVASG